MMFMSIKKSFQALVVLGGYGGHDPCWISSDASQRTDDDREKNPTDENR